MRSPSTVFGSRTGIEEGNALAALDGEIDAFLEAAIAQL
jgi:hypothetical protein